MAQKDDIAAHYDAVAEDYFQQYRRENLREIADYPANYFRLQILLRRLAVARLNSIYEVGVGEGTPLALMSDLGFKVAGCDISQAMVDAACGTFKKKGLDDSAIQWGDIEDATTFANQLAGGPFDAVIAAGVLPHVKNDRLALQNIGMVVRKGGKVFIEFRNKLFSLFTMNRHSKDFILDDLLADVSDDIKQAVAKELDSRLATDVPAARSQVEGTDAPGYDAILSKFHNPFELVELFEKCGYGNCKLHWYHYHPAPPMMEAGLGRAFRDGAIALEHEGSWRGYFLCSAGVVEADFLG